MNESDDRKFKEAVMKEKARRKGWQVNLGESGLYRLEKVLRKFWVENMLRKPKNVFHYLELRKVLKGVEKALGMCWENRNESLLTLENGKLENNPQ